MNIITKFGKKIKELRLAKGMSQGALAKKLGVGPSYISKLERGAQNISLKGMERLANALGVSVNNLLQ